MEVKGVGVGVERAERLRGRRTERPREPGGRREIFVDVVDDGASSLFSFESRREW